MEHQVYGYARVSSREQNEARQLIALGEFPVPERNIYVDKRSGKDFDRPQYRRLLRKLRQGDTLVVLSIDRMGRNYDEILSQWRLITHTKGANIVVLDMPLLDTRQRSGDLTGTFIADMVLQVLSYVAQSERENIRSRQAQGIAAAKARGVQFGRAKRELPPNFDAVAERWQAWEITTAQALQQLQVGKTYFYQQLRERGIRRQHPVCRP